MPAIRLVQPLSSSREKSVAAFSLPFSNFSISSHVPRYPLSPSPALITNTNTTGTTQTYRPMCGTLVHFRWHSSSKQSVSNYNPPLSQLYSEILCVCFLSLKSRVQSSPPPPEAPGTCHLLDEASRETYDKSPQQVRGKKSLVLSIPASRDH